MTSLSVETRNLPQGKPQYDIGLETLTYYSIMCSSHRQAVATLHNIHKRVFTLLLMSLQVSTVGLFSRVYPQHYLA